MKKDFILDEGKIRNCQKNIAMMNVFEYIIFDIFDKNCLKRIFIETIEQYWEGLKSLCLAIINTILLVIFPISLFLKGYFEIKEAKTQMKKWNG